MRKHYGKKLRTCDLPIAETSRSGTIGMGRAYSRRFVGMPGLGFLLAFMLPAYAADSIVIGNAVSNTFAKALTDADKKARPCPEDSLCMDVIYRWVIDTERIIAGPTLKGPISALRFQHIGVNNRYLKSIRLFIFRPIAEVEISHFSNDRYYLVATSPLYEDGTYCISVDPAEIGLQLKTITKKDDGYFCFDHQLLN
jgi:hypothetical protein